MTGTTSVTMDAIIHALGEEGARRMVERCGGMAIDIPKTRRRTKLYQYMPEEEVQKLSQHLGGGRIVVPTGHKDALRQRNREIIECYSKGEAVNDLCRRFNLSSRHIWQILNTPV